MEGWLGVINVNEKNALVRDTAVACLQGTVELIRDVGEVFN